ncbi:MAG: hypothetical protein QX199_12325 [Methylococcaceae bacterium]
MSDKEQRLITLLLKEQVASQEKTFNILLEKSEKTIIAMRRTGYKLIRLFPEFHFLSIKLKCKITTSQ